MEEIMNNNAEVIEEVVEVTETAASGNGFKKAAAAGVAILAGVVIYKKVIKPLVAKIKAKKETSQVVEATADEPVVEVVDSEE